MTIEKNRSLNKVLVKMYPMCTSKYIKKNINAKKDEIKEIYFFHSYFNSFHYYNRYMYCICINLHTCIT